MTTARSHLVRSGRVVGCCRSLRADPCRFVALSMLNCLAAAISGGDRVLSAEEVFELRFPHPDWVPLQTRQA